MHMVIEIKTFECTGDKCYSAWPTSHSGHCMLEVRNAAQPFWGRRPPWAELETVMRPPKSASETLRWAVQQLDANLRPPNRPLFNDDSWDTIEPLIEHPF